VCTNLSNILLRLPSNSLINPTHEKFPSALRACWITLNGIFNKRLKSVGITADQFSALRWIKEVNSQEFCQKDLVKLMFTDANNVAALVERMEKKNFILRSNCPNDKRKKVIKLTSQGIEKWKQASKIANSLERKALGALNDSQKAQLIDFLKKVNGCFYN